jgi:hypothetical protein
MMFRRDGLCPGAHMCPESPDDQTPCTLCPIVYLDSVLESPLGGRLRGVVDLDFAVTARFAVALDDVGYDEFRLLRALHEEREAYRNELMDQQAKQNGQ